MPRASWKAVKRQEALRESSCCRALLLDEVLAGGVKRHYAKEEEGTTGPDKMLKRFPDSILLSH